MASRERWSGKGFWSVLRALEEKAALPAALCSRVRRRSNQVVAMRFKAKSRMQTGATTIVRTLEGR